MPAFSWSVREGSRVIHRLRECEETLNLHPIFLALETYFAILLYFTLTVLRNGDFGMVKMWQVACYCVIRASSLTLQDYAGLNGNL